MKTLSIVSALFLFAAGMGWAALDDYDYGAGSRVNGPPTYRTYDKTSAYQNKTYTNSDYQPEDANEYWGDRYYGDQEEQTDQPEPQDNYDLDKGITDMEDQQVE
jgi:hypothetical protein